MFRDREDAGRRLAKALKAYRGAGGAVVLAVPRGGVAVGAAVARELGLPLDVVLVKKIGHPGSPEYAVGAVDLSGYRVDEEVVGRDGIPQSYIDRQAAALGRRLRERSALYRAGRGSLSLKGRTVVVVDDGAATGHTLLAALRAARREGAARVVAAVPVAPPSALGKLRAWADEVVCLESPEDFLAIGDFYDSFEQLQDDEALRLLREAAAA